MRTRDDAAWAALISAVIVFFLVWGLLTQLGVEKDAGSFGLLAGLVVGGAIGLLSMRRLRK